MTVPSDVRTPHTRAELVEPSDDVGRQYHVIRWGYVTDRFTGARTYGWRQYSGGYRPTGHRYNLSPGPIRSERWLQEWIAWMRTEPTCAHVTIEWVPRRARKAAR